MLLRGLIRLAMKKFIEVCLWMTGCYLVSYFLLIKKVPGEAFADGRIKADPGCRFLKYPQNIKTGFILLYKPLWELDKKLRPNYWWWGGKVEYDVE